MSHIEEFFDMFCDIEPGKNIASTTLYNRFNAWSARNSYRQIPQAKFSREIGKILGRPSRTVSINDEPVRGFTDVVFDEDALSRELNGADTTADAVERQNAIESNAIPEQLELQDEPQKDAEEKGSDSDFWGFAALTAVVGCGVALLAKSLLSR